MKKVIIITFIILLLVIGVFSTLYYYGNQYRDVENSHEYLKIKKQITKVENELKEKEKEKEELIQNNQDKVRLLELWESELNKAKNY